VEKGWSSPMARKLLINEKLREQTAAFFDSTQSYSEARLTI
jgi:hypothetical protein